MALPVQVVVEGSPSDQEREAVFRVLREAGFEPSASVEVTRGLVEVGGAVVIAASLDGFFKTIGAQAAEEGLRVMKGLLARLRAARGHDAAVRLEDTGAGPIVHLDSWLPDDAYRALAGLDWSSLEDGDLSWDATAGSWRLID